jgi:hypothetical protein
MTVWPSLISIEGVRLKTGVKWIARIDGPGLAIGRASRVYQPEDRKGSIKTGDVRTAAI